MGNLVIAKFIFILIEVLDNAVLICMFTLE